jgi:ABC-type sulfate transport system permease component
LCFTAVAVVVATWFVSQPLSSAAVTSSIQRYRSTFHHSHRIGIVKGCIQITTERSIK